VNRRRYLPAAVLVAAVLSVVALLAIGGLKGSLTYYRTPTELVSQPDAGQVRLGGLVLDGSLSAKASTVRFTLSDGANDLPVVTHAVPPSTLREGQGAVVEGRLGSDGVFHADSVVVRHSNEYRPPEPQ
jgi:cytochrome c-type biogenesis protein CcmE